MVWSKVKMVDIVVMLGAIVERLEMSIYAYRAPHNVRRLL